MGVVGNEAVVAIEVVEVARETEEEVEVAEVEVEVEVVEMDLVVEVEVDLEVQVEGALYTTMDCCHKKNAGSWG